MAGQQNHGERQERLYELADIDTANLPPDGGTGFNRLVFTASPYLLQHAANPVDWYPWGEEAFARAVAENKPVFLSIGYATCHWCHVMAHESFEDPAVAEILNRYFVAVKVDREERPDIDEQYMTVAQLMTGSGGWPLTIVMGPDRRPFFAATYLPKEPRPGMPGIVALLENLSLAWRTRREMVEKNCAAVMDSLARLARPFSAPLPGATIFTDAFSKLAGIYDNEWGGFGRAPKFPMPSHLSFLLRYWRRSGEPAALAMVEKSLTKLCAGGIHDHLGGGFHRYAVDRQWLIPHFEKMLYDQALLAMVCLEAFQATGNACFRDTASDICDYVLREMTSLAGGFYSAQDADSEGVEGKFYVWTPAEVREVLGEADGALFCKLFDVTDAGNFESANILHQSTEFEAFARRECLPPVALRRSVARWRELLLRVREERIRPLRDEKVLTAWNGLMIAALARVSAVCGEPRFLAAARHAALFIKNSLQTADGGLLRCYFRGKISTAAFLEDYAFFVWGLLELYGATLDQSFLADARQFNRKMMALFADADGGFFDTAAAAEQLPVRMKSATDGVIPSGNSVAAMNLLRLGRIARDSVLLEAADKQLSAFMGNVRKEPAGYLHMLAALDFLQGPPVDITLAGGRGGGEIREMLACIHGRFIPNLTLRGEVACADEEAEHVRATAHVCAGGACRPPVTTVAALGELLDLCGFGVIPIPDQR